MADLPAELKQLKRFIREAKKTEKISPVIAYYCRLYAIQESMKLDESKKTAASKQWMAAQLTELEQSKVDVSRDEAKQKITSMAHNVFKHADEVDRAGKADKTTAAAFNTAYVFYTVLKQFGDRDDQIVQAAKYCLFKTTDILKALREGRTPKPGPPGDDNDDELNAELAAMGGGDNDANQATAPINDTTNPPQPFQPYQPPSQPVQPVQPSPNNMNNMNNGNMMPQPSPQYQPPPPSSQQQPANASNAIPPSNYMINNAPNYNYQKQMNLPQFENKVQACVEAEKYMKEAMAALRFEDVDTAIKKAEEAIVILRPHNR